MAVERFIGIVKKKILHLYLEIVERNLILFRYSLSLLKISNKVKCTKKCMCLGQNRPI